MILNKPGQGITLEASHLYLYIGQEIVANSDSDYAGLPGIITLIKDGVGTDKPTIDVYCDFALPENDYYLALLERRFESPACEIPLEKVVMAPEMIEPKMAYQINPSTGPFYVLTYCVDSVRECNTFVIAVGSDMERLKQIMDSHIQTNAYFITDGSYDPSLTEFSVFSFDTKSVPDDGKRFLWAAESEETYICYTIFEAPFILSKLKQKESDAEC